MKIKFSLKHTTEQPTKSLVSTELVNDQMYMDLGLTDATALIMDNHIKWSWCGMNLIDTYFYSLQEMKSSGKRFALFPKNSVITFTQDEI
jgi:hypothetical protein